jgi:uncharacterized protein (DUF1684 family)
MTTNVSRPVAGAGLVLALAATSGCHPPLPAAERHWREDREQAVRTELPAQARSHFTGLRFFPFDPGCRFRTMMEPVDPPQPITIAASNGQDRPAHRVGRIHLDLPGGRAVLSVFQLDDIRTEYPDHLFLPFRDAGAGRETYGAGRYVEVERLGGGVVQLDFNRAYNPDCAYGIAARCPITPEENTVRFSVRAGEMMPPGHE